MFYFILFRHGALVRDIIKEILWERYRIYESRFSRDLNGRNRT